MCGGVALIATVVVDTYLVRAEEAAVAAGRIDEAAGFARRVRVLRPLVVERLRKQIPEVAAADRRFPRELPLIEALLELRDDPEMAARRAALRVLRAGPEALELRDAVITLGAAAAPPAAPDTGGGLPTVNAPKGGREPLVTAEPTQAPPTVWGPPFQLRRRNAGGAVIPLGEGVVAPLGRSWDVSPDGRTAIVARPAERVLERWDLPSSRAELVEAAGPPTFVAIRPGPDAHGVAYSTPRDPDSASPRSEVLHVRTRAGSKQVYPLGELRAGALGFTWAPDGGSLLVRWTDRQNRQPGDLLHLAWITPEGGELMTSVVQAGAAMPTARWVAGPGARMGLEAAGSVWAWDGREPTARPLPGVRGAWGWSPDGRLIAGLDVGHVFVAATEDTRRRVDHKVEGLPPFFVLDERGFGWNAEGLLFEGRTAERESGPWRKAKVTVRLIAKE